MDMNKKTHSPLLYSQSNQVQHKVNLRVLDLVDTAFKEGMGEEQQFLDIGCGVGDFTRNVLLTRCPPIRRLIAVDVSREMLNYAAEHNSHPKITYDYLDVGGDVTGFAKKYGKFDRIYSFYCLHWVKDQEKAMKNIAQLMQPGGECLLLFPANSPLYKVWNEIGEMNRWKTYKQVYESYTSRSESLATESDLLEYLTALIKSSGLIPRSLYLFPTAVFEEGLESAVRFAIAADPVVPLLAEGDYEDYTRDVTAAIAKMLNDDETLASCTGYKFLVHASKPERENEKRMP